MDEMEIPEGSEILSNPLGNGMTFEEAVKSLGPEQLKTYMEGQYNFLNKHCGNLQAQLFELKSKVDANNKDLISRVERLLIQLTNHMAIIRQLIDLVNACTDRIALQEKVSAKHELAYATIVERQNKFAIALSKLEKSGKDIVTELDDVRAKEESHSALEWKLFTVLSIGAAIIMWLLTGDNFAKILIAIKNATS